METIIASVITGAVGILVCMINNYFQQRSVKKQNGETVALIDYKLSELTKRVDKHNNVVERTYKLEEEGKVMQEQIRVANHRIKDLEEKE